MVKLKFAVLKSTRAKDGTYKVRIAIGHKSETHYITTPYAVPSPSHFVAGVIVGTPTAHHDNIKLRQILTDYEERLERIPNPSDYSPTELRDALKRMRPTTSTATLLQAFQTKRGNMVTEKRNHKFLDYTQQKALAFLHGDVPLSSITPTTIESFRRYLQIARLAANTINTIMSQLRHVINTSIRDGLVRYDINPFAYWHNLPTAFRDVDLTPPELRIIRDSRPTKIGHIIARDFLMLSYYLGGINLVDLLAVDFSKAKGTIDYIRRKTEKTAATRVQFAIIPEAQQIIERYTNDKGRIIVTRGNTRINAPTIYINRNIKSLAKKLGIPSHDKLTYYTARKSFVQHGFDLGIPLETLEYCVGHTTNHGRTIYNYMRVMRRHADEAIRKIVDNLK